MNKSKTKDELIRDALEALSEEYPNSIVTDMLCNFSHDVVLRFLTLYNGRQINVPHVETIWKSYRNKIIFNTLVVNNSRVTRQQLSAYFRILESTISKIFHSECNKLQPRITQAALERVVQTIYNKQVLKLHKDMKKLFSDKYNVQYFTLHDMTQNPEDLFLMNEAVDNLKNRCLKDIEEHKIFVGRENKIEEANILLLLLIKDNH